MSAVAAIILAAGTSSRFLASGAEEPTKLVARVDDVPLVRRVALAALASRGRPVIVVTGHAEGAVRAALAGLDLAVAHNPGFASGLAGSLRTGLDALPQTAIAALILLGDMPYVDAGVLDALIETFAGTPGVDAVAPVRDGRRGNPVLLGRSLFAPARRLTGDEGARRLLRKARVADVAVAHGGVTTDIDVVSDLRCRETAPGERGDA